LNVLIPRVEVYVAARQAAPVRKKGAPTELRVFSQVTPHLDPDRIAAILLNLTREHHARDQDDKAA